MRHFGKIFGPVQEELTRAPLAKACDVVFMGKAQGSCYAVEYDDLAI